MKLHIIRSRTQRVNLHARPSIIQVGCPTCCYQVCALDHAKGGTADLNYPSEPCHHNDWDPMSRAWGSLGLYTSEQHWSDMLHYSETDNLLTVLTSTQKSSRADSTSSRGPDIRTLVLPMLTWSLSFHASLPEDNSLAVPPAILSLWFADPEHAEVSLDGIWPQ